MTIANRAWLERNLGFDPNVTQAPAASFAFAAAGKPGRTVEDLQREIIDFDSEGPEGTAFMAFSKATGLSRFTDIPWPKALAPKTGTKPRGRSTSPLPRADVLVVTWTTDEGHALSRVLTPGKDSKNNYVPYRHNYDKIAPTMSKGCPAVKANRLGSYWTTTIGDKKVVVFKSESHLSQDTFKHLPKSLVVPNAVVWKQIIEEVRPKLVITTGTGGGIGKELEVGDVIVSPVVRFSSRKWLKPAPFANASFHSSPAPTRLFATARKLFDANSNQLPQDNTRAPKIITVAPRNLSSSVVTTDFFGFDTSNNYYKLWKLGDLSEMGDAVLGMVAKQMGAEAPPWIAVRNVSDPQIKAEGSIKQQADRAAQIYKGFGRWSSICSAIVCWAIIAS
jgi:nucleoside phosphorylase